MKAFHDTDTNQLLVTDYTGTEEEVKRVKDLLGGGWVKQKQWINTDHRDPSYCVLFVLPKQERVLVNAEVKREEEYRKSNYTVGKDSFIIVYST